jgi:hypothetical protein
MLPPDAIDFYGFFVRLAGFADTVPSHVPTWLTTLGYIANTIAVIGLAVAFLLLVLLVFVSIRLEQLEHHGFHHREMAEHLVHELHGHTAPKNPRWEGVTLLASSLSESDWRRAIMEADIMLSDLLKEQGYPGDTLGEQLKMANPLQFTTLDLAWEAHRMRNALAHLGEAFPLTERDTRATIEQYRRVFEEFNYI